MSDQTEPRISRLRTSDAQVTVTPAPALEPPEAGTLPAPRSVLVVDDDEMVRWCTARELRRAGYEVLEAAGADEALICMQEHGASVSLILSDVIMPKQNGYELCQAVRARWPHAQVMLVSGYTPGAINRHEIRTAGFSLLQRPIPNLLEIVTRLIGPPETMRPYAALAEGDAEQQIDVRNRNDVGQDGPGVLRRRERPPRCC